MSKRKSSDGRPGRPVSEGRRGSREPAGTRPGEAQAGAAGGFFSQAAIRETVESIIVAFVLAFLFRTFEAEAFVIPTGSMAPTLMGRHKDLCCPECGYEYQVSASERDRPRVETRGRYTSKAAPARCAAIRRTSARGTRSTRVTPPTTATASWSPSSHTSSRSRERWDVIVFKYPGNADDELHQAAGGPAGRDDPRSATAIFGSARGGGAVRHRPQATGQAAGHAPAGIRQRLSAEDHRGLGWPARWQAEPPAGDGAATWTVSADGARSRPRAPPAGKLAPLPASGALL